jgi:hypothetical protein
MHLAVFFASVVAQKYFVGRQYITVAEQCGRGQVSTSRVWKMRDLPLTQAHDLRHTASGRK